MNAIRSVTPGLHPGATIFRRNPIRPRTGVFLMIDSTTSNYNSPTAAEAEDQMGEYFTTLFPDLAKNEKIHIRCLNTSGAAVAHEFFSTIDRAILFCLKHSGKNHVYSAVNPKDRDKVREEKASGRTKGGGKNTVSRVVTLWADYDLEKFGKSREKGLEVLQNLSSPPSMIMFTGGGCSLIGSWMSPQGVLRTWPAPSTLSMPSPCGGA
jgi:hypothetical protein